MRWDCGCPMDCEFCSVTAFNRRRYHRRPPEEVLDELAEIPQKMIFLGAFIFGMDDDTPEWLRRRTEFMVHSGIDVMQKTFLTPLPGTRMFDRLHREGRLLFADCPSDWEHYDMGEAVHTPRGMIPEALTRVMDVASRRMFAWPVLAGKALRTLCRTRNLAAAMFAWQSNLNYRKVSFE